MRRLLTLVCVGAVSVGSAQTNDWPAYGHDAGGTRYSPLTQITPKNVAKLRRAWTYHTGELQGTRDSVRVGTTRRSAFQTTPLMIGGVLYLSTPSTRVPCARKYCSR